MNTFKLSDRDRKIENILVAQAMMIDIPDELIYPHLTRWYGPKECGSPACFGGWVARHPHFRKRGVQVDRDEHSPTNRAGEDSDRISENLFGDEDMFSVNFSGRSDRTEINRRLETALEALL